jgi:hypothetical protein
MVLIQPFRVVHLNSFRNPGLQPGLLKIEALQASMALSHIFLQAGRLLILNAAPIHSIIIKSRAA